MSLNAVRFGRIAIMEGPTVQNGSTATYFQVTGPSDTDRFRHLMNDDGKFGVILKDNRIQWVRDGEAINSRDIVLGSPILKELLVLFTMVRNAGFSSFPVALAEEHQRALVDEVGNR